MKKKLSLAIVFIGIILGVMSFSLHFAPAQAQTLVCPLDTCGLTLTPTPTIDGADCDGDAGTDPADDLCPTDTPIASPEVTTTPTATPTAVLDTPTPPTSLTTPTAGNSATPTPQPSSPTATPTPMQPGETLIPCRPGVCGYK